MRDIQINNKVIHKECLKNNNGTGRMSARDMNKSDSEFPLWAERSNNSSNSSLDSSGSSGSAVNSSSRKVPYSSYNEYLKSYEKKQFAPVKLETNETPVQHNLTGTDKKNVKSEIFIQIAPDKQKNNGTTTFVIPITNSSTSSPYSKSNGIKLSAVGEANQVNHSATKISHGQEIQREKGHTLTRVVSFEIKPKPNEVYVRQQAQRLNVTPTYAKPFVFPVKLQVNGKTSVSTVPRVSSTLPSPIPQNTQFSVKALVNRQNSSSPPFPFEPEVANQETLAPPPPPPLSQQFVSTVHPQMNGNGSVLNLSPPPPPPALFVSVAKPQLKGSSTITNSEENGTSTIQNVLLLPPPPPPPMPSQQQLSTNCRTIRSQEIVPHSPHLSSSATLPRNFGQSKNANAFSPDVFLDELKSKTKRYDPPDVPTTSGLHRTSSSREPVRNVLPNNSHSNTLPPKKKLVAPPQFHHVLKTNQRANSVNKVSNEEAKVTTVVPVADSMDCVAKGDPNVKKLVYSTYRELLVAYNNRANAIISTTPGISVQEDLGVARQLEMLAQNGGIEKLNGRINPRKEDE